LTIFFFSAAIPRDLMLRLFYIIVNLLLFAYYETCIIWHQNFARKRESWKSFGNHRGRHRPDTEWNNVAQRDMIRNGNIKQRRTRECAENNTKLRKNERWNRNRNYTRPFFLIYPRSDATVKRILRIDV